MKNIKIIALIFALMAMLPLHVFAQNEENSVCRDEECVMKILNNLNSTDQLVVADAEKEIEVLADYAGRTGEIEVRDALKKAMISFIYENENCHSNAYLISLLPRFCDDRDVREIAKLFNSDKVGGCAIRAMADMPNTRDYIIKLVPSNPESQKTRAAMAYAAGKQDIAQMENDLIEWLKDADDATKIEIYDALLVVGSSENTTKLVVKGAKKLCKSQNLDYKLAGMRILVAAEGEKALPMLYKSLKDKNRRVRVAALDLMKPYANNKVCAKAVKICKKGDAVVDVLNWLGEIKNDSQMQFVIKQLSSQNPEVVIAAIRAVFTIDNPDGIAAVKPMFGGEYQEVIKEEMVKYEGDYFSVLNDVIRGNDQQKLAALQIIEARPILETNRRVTELLNSNNQAVRDEAYTVLKYVVMPANAEALVVQLQFCDDKYVNDVQLAFKNAMAKAPDSAKDKIASTLKHVKPEVMPRFYKVFAYFGTELCVNKLIEAYQNGPYRMDAKAALLLVDNEQYTELIQNTLK